MIRTAAVFHHDLYDGKGTIGEVLLERGIAVEDITTFETPPAGFDPLRHDLLVVMGGACGVYQADDYPFLKDELRVMTARLKADRPIFGICLGSQLMAAALGARVYKGKQGPEHGWFDVRPTQAGEGSPLRHFKGHPVMQWHGDTFDLPPGAEVLASSDLYAHQAIRHGNNALGVQFHPELTPRILRYWMVEAAYSAHAGTFDLDKVRAETENYLPVMQKQTRAFFHEWLDQADATV